MYFRENILQEASTKNQVYQSTYKSMQSFLDKLPAEQISSSDDLAQLAAKQNSHEVRTLVGPQCLTAPLHSVMSACSTLHHRG